MPSKYALLYYNTSIDLELPVYGQEATNQPCKKGIQIGYRWLIYMPLISPQYVLISAKNYIFQALLWIFNYLFLILVPKVTHHLFLARVAKQLTVYCAKLQGKNLTPVIPL